MNTKSKIAIEVCCGSASDAFIAASAGADRVELNSSLFFGGLTPSIGEIERAVESGIPVMVMIRPRMGGFKYDPFHIDVMQRDIRSAIKAGASGVVFGCLTHDDSGNLVVDEYACKHLIESADGHETVFHRAFDMLQHNWKSSTEKLIKLGFNRILTSGHSKTALEGAARLAGLIKFAGNDIEILPCGKIRTDNVMEIIRKTGCNQVHTSASGWLTDDTAAANGSIAFIASEIPGDKIYPTINHNTLVEFAETVHGKGGYLN